MAKRKARTAESIEPLMKRKNMFIDQRKLDRVRAVLGVDSETAAVDAALDMIVFREEVMEGLERVAARGGVTYWDPSDRPADDLQP